jgi:uncharacterized membrane protein YbhN (UPF0104 family)
MSCRFPLSEVEWQVILTAGYSTVKAGFPPNFANLTRHVRAGGVEPPIAGAFLDFLPDRRHPGTVNIFLPPAMISGPARRRALIAARVAVSVAALWLAFGWVDLGGVATSMAAAGPLPIVMTLGVYLVSQGVSAARWMLIARALGFALKPRTAVTYYFIGMFFNFLGPSMLGGDVARSLYLSRGPARMSVAAASVALDRYVGFVWLTVLCSAAQIFFGSFSLPARLVWTTHALALIALTSWVVLPRVAAGRLPPGLLGARWSASILSVIFHLIQISAAVVLAHALSASTPWRYCFVFHPLVAIVSALPISVAGLGVRESGYVYFLASVQGAPASQAGAFAAAWLAILTASSAIGGVVFLLNGGRLPRERAANAGTHHSTQLPPSS